MLNPTTAPLRPSKNASAKTDGYFLSDVRLDIPTYDTAVFNAKLNGPPGASVWTRAWLSTEADGTLAETASSPLKAGEAVTLKVTLRTDRTPEIACIRIESAPLATEHVVIIPLK